MGFLKKGRKKKGQVTLFIIIGILLLAIVIFALILINRSKDIDGFQPDEVPPELVPIGNYVEDCLYETSEQAFRVLGDNGGYINPQNYFEKGFVPTESDILEFSPGSSIWMPYWWYLESENDCNSDCMFGSHMPPLEGSGNFGPNSLLSEVNVEGMIEIYIEQNLGNCLNEFGLLTNEFEIVAEKDPEIRTSILANNIVIDLTYPLEINSGVGEGKLERFRIYLPLNFRRIYNMAKDITTAQQQLNFLDYHAITLIDLFSDIDRDKLPPLEGTKFELGSQEYWFESEVKENVESILTSYVPAMQVLGSRNYDAEAINAIEDPMVRGIFRNMMVPLENNYPLIESSFTYLPTWASYVHITPNNGGILAPDPFFPPFLPIGIQHYRFSYDVSYPVLVTLEDVSAFNGEGYTLLFALESNIRNNDVINTSDIQLEMLAGQSESSMVCDIEKRNSGDVTINVMDSFTEEPVENAALTFVLGSEGCLIGSTDENGTFVGKFPVGLGVLKIVKQDYYSESIPFGIGYLQESSESAEIMPIKTLNVKVMTKTMKKMGRDNWQYEGVLKALDDNEEAILLLERVTETVYDEEYSVPISFVKGEESEVRLIPGRYKINGQIILNEQLIIPEDTREECVEFLGIPIDCEEYTIDEQVLDQSVSGGLNIVGSGRNEYVIITEEDLKNDNIKFYAISFSLKSIPESAREVEDISKIGNLEEFSSNNREELEPLFS